MQTNTIDQNDSLIRNKSLATTVHYISPSWHCISSRRCQITLLAQLLLLVSWVLQAWEYITAGLLQAFVPLTNARVTLPSHHYHFIALSAKHYLALQVLWSISDASARARLHYERVCAITLVLGIDCI